MNKNIIKIFSLLFIFFLSLLLVSCQKYTFKSTDLEGVWTMKRETIIVGGEDYCKYDRGLVLLQFENDTLLFSSLYTIDDEDEINQENLDNAKENYENNFIKLMKFSNNEIETVYDHQQKIVTALSIKSAKIKNGFIEVRLLNNRTDESVMISEIYILLKKTNLTF